MVKVRFANGMWREANSNLLPSVFSPSTSHRWCLMMQITTRWEGERRMKVLPQNREGERWKRTEGVMKVEALEQQLGRILSRSSRLTKKQWGSTTCSCPTTTRWVGAGAKTRTFMRQHTHHRCVHETCDTISNGSVTWPQGNFTGGERCALWKRMKNTETKAKINLDESPLGALHKVHTNTHVMSHQVRGKEGGGGKHW